MRSAAFAARFRCSSTIGSAAAISRRPGGACQTADIGAHPLCRAPRPAIPQGSVAVEAIRPAHHHQRRRRPDALSADLAILLMLRRRLPAQIRSSIRNNQQWHDRCRVTNGSFTAQSARKIFQPWQLTGACWFIPLCGVERYVAASRSVSAIRCSALRSCCRRHTPIRQPGFTATIIHRPSVARAQGAARHTTGYAGGRRSAQMNWSTTNAPSRSAWAGAGQAAADLEQPLSIDARFAAAYLPPRAT